MWLAENEGAKFWLNVLTELKNRGLNDILIACVDGLKGFPDAINTVYPKARIQLCIVHMVRNSLRFVSWKDYKAVTRDLKAIYQAHGRGRSAGTGSVRCGWDSRYPQISRSWQANWPNLATFFAYPTDIRKVIYTTNAIESLNSVIRHAIKKRKVFPTDDSVKKKVVWLAIQSASQKWTMPLKDWRMAMSRFIIEFGDPGRSLLRKGIYTES